MSFQETYEKKLIGLHNDGLHGSITESVFVVFRNDDPTDMISFDQRKDADKYMEVRLAQGLWKYTKVSGVMRIKDGIITTGPTLVEKYPNCPLCTKKETDNQ